jgi:two-component system response regulator (stage 0 sporulation protein A)
MDAIRVLVVNGSRAVRETINRELWGKRDIELAGSVGNSVSALKIIQSNRADVVITDLVMPESDDFWLIEAIQEFMRDKKIRVIVLTDLTHDDYICRAMSLGVEYYMLKPFDPVLIRQRIVEPLPSLTPYFQEDIRQQEDLEPQTSLCRLGCSLERKIADILFSLGIPAHIKGYYFLREAVRLTVENPDIINAITKELYPAVAGCFNTSSLRVERAICHAINVGWGRGRGEMKQMTVRPTNGGLIALIANRLIISGCTVAIQGSA